MTLNELSELIVRNRSYRRFRQTPRPGRRRLETWVDRVRLTASGGNRQPLRFRLVHDPAECAAVFPLTRWAGLLKEWSPAVDEAPTAYVLVLSAAGGATPQTDAGIAMQTLLLAAVADGFGGCMLGAIDRPAIQATLNLPVSLELLYAVALGKPAETCRVETAIDGQTAYYRSADDIHHVPKLPLDVLLVPDA